MKTRLIKLDDVEVLAQLLEDDDSDLAFNLSFWHDGEYHCEQFAVPSGTVGEGLIRDFSDLSAREWVDAELGTPAKCETCGHEVKN